MLNFGNVVFGLLALSNVGVTLASKVENLENYSVFYGLASTASKENSMECDCYKKLSRIAHGVRNEEIWALKLLDASGSPETGAYWGNIYWLGSKLQCQSAHKYKQWPLGPRSINKFETPDYLSPFPVEYFAAYFYTNSSFRISTQWREENKITLGLCLPDTCTPSEISSLLQIYFDSGRLVQQNLYNLTYTLSKVKKVGVKTDLNDPMIKILIIWFIVAVVLVGTGTFYDVFIHQPSLVQKSKTTTSNVALTDSKKLEEKVQRIMLNENGNVLKAPEGINEDMLPESLKKLLVGVSAYSNFQKLITIKSGSGTMLPLVGLRLIMSWLIIASHVVSYPYDLFNNRPKTMYYTDSSLGKLLTNTWFFVDVFFTLGGFLMVYTISKSKEMSDEEEHSNWSLFKAWALGIFRRYRRLTPIYIFVMLVAYTSFAISNNNSAYWSSETKHAQCGTVWWTNLLYINNIYPAKAHDMCISWTWYLASDMQFFIVVSFLYILSNKYYKTSVTLTLGIMFTCYTIAGVKTYITGYRPFPDELITTIKEFYYAPWMRINTYIIGAILGCMYRKLDGKLEMRKAYVYILWIVSGAAIVSLTFGFTDKNFSTPVAIFYTAFARSVCCIAASWVILACLTGHGGFLTSFLSFRGFQLFSSLSYTAYMTHCIILMHLLIESDGSWSFQHGTTILVTGGLLLITYITCVVLVLLVELPFDNLLVTLTEPSTNIHKIPVKPKQFENGTSGTNDTASKTIKNE